VAQKLASSERRLTPEIGSVEDSQPRAIRLAARNLRPRAGLVLRWRRGEGEVADAQGRQRFLLLEVGRLRKHLFIEGADRVAPDGRLAWRERYNGVGLIEGSEPFGVSGVRKLNE
jgi:hypothetical protein